jgi:hypothetical protein
MDMLSPLSTLFSKSLVIVCSIYRCAPLGLPPFWGLNMNMWWGTVSCCRSAAPASQQHAHIGSGLGSISSQVPVAVCRVAI